MSEQSFQGSYFARTAKLSICGKPLMTPTYFPSISGAGSRFDLNHLIDLCLNSGYPRALISAFDLFRFSNTILVSIKNSLEKFHSEKKLIFLDSGTFEKFWLQHGEWNFENYEKIVKDIQCDLYASYDDFAKPGETATSITENIIRNVSRSLNLNNEGKCLTVVHGPGKLPEVITKITSMRPDLCEAISIPERECGNSIEIRIKTISSIRKALREKSVDAFIHILGCGNLISMALYTMAGADSFDSVDWSRWLLNRNDCKYTDIAHISILECDCNVCRMSDLESIIKSIYHNLLFYQDFLSSFRNAIRSKTEFKFLRSYIGESAASNIVKLFNDDDFS